MGKSFWTQTSFLQGLEFSNNDLKAFILKLLNFQHVIFDQTMKTPKCNKCSYFVHDYFAEIGTIYFFFRG